MTQPSFVLPDVLDFDLRVVFCGTAAGTASAQAKAYYAGPGNRFWQTLYYIGLTPYPFEAQDFQDVTKFGIGLTDLAKYTSGADRDLNPNDFDRDGLDAKIQQYQPGVVAFTGKTAAKYYLQRTTVDYGKQPPSLFGKTEFFILPSPSGAARGFWDISFWYDLAAIVKYL